MIKLEGNSDLFAGKLEKKNIKNKNAGLHAHNVHNCFY